MSTDIHEGTVYVTRYVGPRDLEPDRARWQITLPSGYFAVIDRAEAVVLAAALANSAADKPA